MVSFHILWNFFWMQAYAPFSPAGTAHANDPFSVILRKILHPPSPIPNAKIPRNEGRERHRQNTLIQVSLWGSKTTYRHRNMIWLLLPLFFMWCMFISTNIFMDGQLILLCMTQWKVCEICSYIDSGLYTFKFQLSSLLNNCILEKIILNAFKIAYSLWLSFFTCKVERAKSAFSGMFQSWISVREGEALHRILFALLI